MTERPIPEKAREARLRRKARRFGLRLAKSRSRDRRAREFGTYMLLDADLEIIVLCKPTADGYGLLLDDVEAWLDGGETEAWDIKTRVEFLRHLAGDDELFSQLLGDRAPDIGPNASADDADLDEVERS